ncbi:sugar phosphate nucleotidyltransferase [Helicobacter sp. MIT 99-5507]|uniref:phosphocholine cytidylyltransferase family protein n=1 Tax=Helicobacter sp. MIT 99-5507 TaxID=152489 RepID=UPI000E1E4B66|nr:phosphocholine cytidylyltransferase family protein [Helicobacter sp. MIT 99-5507]RDU58253.1 sugar nucleotidyltransferase [Helicobacter sp. MIT 99-5507]
MRALILAAGKGTRLAPLTNDIPKCMVKYNNKSIIDYELEALKENNITDIGIIGGYLSNVLKQYININKFYINDRFENTNMVWTMFCAREFLESCAKDKQDLIITYADIIYKSEIIKKLKNYDGDFGVIVDKNWKELWNDRFEDVLSDAESLKIKNNKIIEIGKKVDSIDEIEGQYIGLFKISHNFITTMIDFYDSLDKSRIYDGKDFYNMYMTSFLQEIINTFNNIEPVFINRGWIEIDSIADLETKL